jgi:hypothetical protein
MINGQSVDEFFIRPPLEPETPRIFTKMDIDRPATIEDSINVYRIVPPQMLLRHQLRLGKLLFGHIEPNANNRVFKVSPSSGCVSFVDYSRLWTGDESYALPEKSQEVEKKARIFLQTANKIFSNDREIIKDGLNRIWFFPRYFEKIDVRAVFGAGESRADHWLCRFKTFLPSGNKDTQSYERPKTNHSDDLTTVIGAKVELSIGSGNEVLGDKSYIIGLWSTWRPTFPVPILSEKYPPPKKNNVGNLGNNSDANSEHSLQLYYATNSEAEPQKFVAPNYLVTELEESHEFPASPYSVVVRILLHYENDGSAVLSSLVVGKDGKIMSANEVQSRFKHYWAYWRLDTGNPQDFQELGNGTQIKLNHGVYNVVLVLSHIQNGSTKSTQEVVYAGLDLASQRKDFQKEAEANE